MSWTCLPRRVSQGLRVLGPCFHRRHPRVFSGLFGLHLVSGERAHRKALARHGPAHLASQHDRRRRCATYWGTTTWLGWVAAQALPALPPPEDGLLDLVGDSPLKGTRGSKHPVAQNTRRSRYHPSVFGCRLVLLMAQGDVSRIPVDCALIRRQDAPDDQSDNALFRPMWRDFRRPAWGQEMGVTAEAADASRAHVERLHTQGSWDVMALPRPWKFATGKALKDLVTHRPRGQ